MPSEAIEGRCDPNVLLIQEVPKVFDNAIKATMVGVLDSPIGKQFITVPTEQVKTAGSGQD